MLFVADDLDAVVAEVNVTSNAVRALSLIASINPASFNATTTSTGAITTRAGGSFTYSGGSIGAVSHEANGGATRLLVLDGSNHTDADSLIVAVGAGATNIPASGGYIYDGVQVLATRGALKTTQSGTFRITASFTGTGGTFTYATTGASPSFGLSGSGTITKGTGRFAATGLLLDPDASGSAGNIVTRLDGLFDGSAGAAVAGVFATTPSTGTKYGGGFVGGAPTIAKVIERFSDGTGLAEAAIGLAGAGQQSQLLFVADDLDAVVTEVNVTSDAVRALSLIASINPTSFNVTTTSTAAIITRTGGSFSYSGESIGVVSREANGGATRLLVLDGSTNDDADSLIVAVGAGATNIPATGGYTYDGVHVLATRGALRTAQSGTFRITANFTGTGGTFTYATTGAAPPFELSGSGTITKGAGRFAATGLLLDPDASGSAGNIVTRLDGLFDGSDGAAVAGVFATTPGSGTRYGGGFVGGAPTIAKVIERFSDGTGLAEAALRIGGSSQQSHLLFVADDLDAVVAEVNVTSDAARALSLIASINPTSFNATTTSTGAITTRTGGSFTYSGESIGVVSHEAAAVRQDFLFLMVQPMPMPTRSLSPLAPVQQIFRQAAATSMTVFMSWRHAAHQRQRRAGHSA